jgi:hypothetical protein
MQDGDRGDEAPGDQRSRQLEGLLSSGSEPARPTAGGLVGRVHAVAGSNRGAHGKMDAMPDRLGVLLVHPLRHRLLLEYASGPDSPGRIAKRLGEAVNNIAYHTGVLQRHGFIELVRTERHRGVLSRWYRSTVGPVIDAAQWEALPLPLRRALTIGTLEQIAEESRRALADGGFDHPDAHVSRFPLELDRQGVEDVARVLREADEALARIGARARERARADRVPHEIVILRFDPAPGGSDVADPQVRARPA